MSGFLRSSQLGSWSGQLLLWLSWGDRRHSESISDWWSSSLPLPFLAEAASCWSISVAAANF